MSRNDQKAAAAAENNAPESATPPVAETDQLSYPSELKAHSEFKSALVLLDDIRTDLIKLRPAQTKTEEYALLKSAIANIGQLQPVTVGDDPNAPGKYVLVDGLQRFTILRELGHDKIKVVVDNEAAADPLLAQVQLNMQRVRTRPADLARAVRLYYSENSHLTISQLGQRFGQTGTWASKMLNLVRLNPEIQELVNNQTIALTNAIALSNLPGEQQAAYVTDAVALSVADFAKKVDDQVKANKEATSKGTKPVVEFKARPKGRSIETIKAEIETLTQCEKLTDDSMSRAQVWQAALEYAISLDGPTLAAALADFEAKQKEAADNRAKAAAARKAKNGQAATAGALDALLGADSSDAVETPVEA